MITGRFMRRGTLLRGTEVKFAHKKTLGEQLHFRVIAETDVQSGSGCVIRGPKAIEPRLTQGFGWLSKAKACFNER
ncbi:MAG: hypothetical protein CMJ47_11585 [Planctomyces sp.]|nr:hypothetical protein [Planctomyces sp.]